MELMISKIWTEHLTQRKLQTDRWVSNSYESSELKLWCGNLLPRTDRQTYPLQNIMYLLPTKQKLDLLYFSKSLLTHALS